MTGRATTRSPIRDVSLAVIAAVLLLPRPSPAQTSRFLPTIATVRGQLTVDMSLESISSASAGREQRITDRYAAERLRLNLYGYIYDPRFISFLAGAGAGLQQENYQTPGSEPGWTTATAQEHEMRVHILPAHPYRLELYSVKSTPFTRSASAGDTRTTTREQGALFTYAKNPLFFSAAAISNRLTSRFSTVDTDTGRVNASYTIGPFANAAGLSRSESHTSTGITLERDNSFLENSFTIGPLSVQSKGSETRQIQNPLDLATYRNDTRIWTEQMSLKLPWNFGLIGSFERRKDLVENSGGALQPPNLNESASDTTRATLSHRIYDSVRTGYSIDHRSTTTSDGDIESTSQRLSGSYTKRIPGGRIMAAGYGSRTVTARSGSLFVTEVHQASIFGNFPLNEESPDLATLTVRVRHPDTGALSLLQEGFHYIVDTLGVASRIVILDLPADVRDSRPADYSHEFHASYSQAGSLQASNLETTGAGYSFTLSLFENRVNPYYHHAVSEQGLLSGTLPGDLHDSTNRTTGVVLRHDAYSLLSEYQSFQSTVNPSRTFRSSLDYADEAGRGAKLFTRVHYTASSYPQAIGRLGSYNESAYGAEARYQKTFPHKNLHVSVGASVVAREAASESQSYALTGSFTWKSGKLLTTAGANMSRSVFDFQAATRRTARDYLYITVSRDLF